VNTLQQLACCNGNGVLRNELTVNRQKGSQQKGDALGALHERFWVAETQKGLGKMSSVKWML
jgi:hypothetical protein